MRGRFDEALTFAESARKSVRAGEHRGWLFASVTLIETLLEAGQAARARQLADESVALAREAELGVVSELRLLILLARCETDLLELDAARKHIDTALELAERCGLAGILLGSLHEVAADHALRTGDEAGFDRHASGIARHSCAHESPILLDRYHRLLDRAERKGFALSERTAASRSAFARRSLGKEVLLELGPAGATPAGILGMLLRKMGATAGYLFAANADGRLVQVAPLGSEAPPGMRETLTSASSIETAHTHSSVFDTQTATLTTVWRAPGGQLYQTAALTMLSDGELRTAGALAIAIGSEPAAIPRLDYLLAVGELLAAASRDSLGPTERASALSM
jgi:hypothetical protein